MLAVSMCLFCTFTTDPQGERMRVSPARFLVLSMDSVFIASALVLTLYLLYLSSRRPGVIITNTNFQDGQKLPEHLSCAR